MINKADIKISIFYNLINKYKPLAILNRKYKDTHKQLKEIYRLHYAFIYLFNNNKYNTDEYNSFVVKQSLNSWERLEYRVRRESGIKLSEQPTICDIIFEQQQMSPQDVLKKEILRIERINKKISGEKQKQRKEKLREKLSSYVQEHTTRYGPLKIDLLRPDWV